MITGHQAQLMREAYRSAAYAAGNSDPNPAVGAVIASESGVILSRGHTQRAGFAHAERHALAQLPEIDLSAATMYVTLEPCCHHGRTPPCVDAILERKIRRVVIAERDLAAEVMGRSVAILSEKGVDVILSEPATFAPEAWHTTGPFFFSRKHARPRITLKWAQTRDGALAPESGPSGPISGTFAAFMTAALRSIHKLTMATPGTVRLDQPKLTVRFGELPGLSGTGLSEFFQHLLLAQYSLATTAHTADELRTAIKPAAQEFLSSPASFHDNFRTAMEAKLSEIMEAGFNSVLIEAGPIFSELLLAHGFVDAIVVYRSKNKTAAGLWGKAGRSNSASRSLAAGDSLSNFTVIERADLEDDDFLYLRRDS